MFKFFFKIPHDRVIFFQVFDWLFLNFENSNWELRFNSKEVCIELGFKSKEDLAWIRYVWGHVEYKN